MSSLHFPEIRPSQELLTICFPSKENCHVLWWNKHLLLQETLFQCCFWQRRLCDLEKSLLWARAFPCADLGRLSIGPGDPKKASHHFPLLCGTSRRPDIYWKHLSEWIHHWWIWIGHTARSLMQNKLINAKEVKVFVGLVPDCQDKCKIFAQDWLLGRGGESVAPWLPLVTPWEGPKHRSSSPALGVSLTSLFTWEGLFSWWGELFLVHAVKGTYSSIRPELIFFSDVSCKCASRRSGSNGFPSCWCCRLPSLCRGREVMCWRNKCLSIFLSAILTRVGCNKLLCDKMNSGTAQPLRKCVIRERGQVSMEDIHQVHTCMCSKKR